MGLAVHVCYDHDLSCVTAISGEGVVCRQGFKYTQLRLCTYTHNSSSIVWTRARCCMWWCADVYVTVRAQQRANCVLSHSLQALSYSTDRAYIRGFTTEYFWLFSIHRRCSLCTYCLCAQTPSPVANYSWTCHRIIWRTLEAKGYCSGCVNLHQSFLRPACRGYAVRLLCVNIAAGALRLSLASTTTT